MDVLWYLNRYGIGITIIAIITITYNYYSIWMYDDVYGYDSQCLSPC